MRSIIVSLVLFEICWATPSNRLVRVSENRSIQKLLPKVGAWDNWGREKLRTVVALDMLMQNKEFLAPDLIESIVSDPNYIPNATQLLERALEKRALTGVIDKPLLWQIRDPSGQRHGMLATIHNLSLNSFSSTAQTAINNEIAHAQVLLSETGQIGTISLDSQINLIGVNKQLVALDTHTVQAPIEIKTEIADHRDPIASYVEFLENIELFHISYREGNWQKMSELAGKIYQNPDLYQINTRNHQWLERIIDNCHQPCFITAGSIHMLLDNEVTTSIISLLRQRGFEIGVAS